MRLFLGAILLALSACHPAATTGPAMTADASSSAPPVAAECSRDLDCAITQRLPNCCTACAPRALPVTSRDSLEVRCEGRDTSCVQPLCRAPPAPPGAVCVQGRCQVRPGRIDRR